MRKMPKIPTFAHFARELNNLEDEAARALPELAGRAGAVALFLKERLCDAAAHFQERARHELDLEKKSLAEKEQKWSAEIAESGRQAAALKSELTRV